MPYALPITLLAALAVSLALNAWIAGKLYKARVEAEDAEERAGERGTMLAKLTRLNREMAADAAIGTRVRKQRAAALARAQAVNAAKRANGAAAAHAG